MESASAQDPVHAPILFPLPALRDDIPADDIPALRQALDDLFNTVAYKFGAFYDMVCSKFHDSEHTVDQLKQKIQILETKNRSLTSDLDCIDDNLCGFDLDRHLHLFGTIEKLTLRVKDLEEDKQNQQKEITHTKWLLEGLLDEWLNCPLAAPHPAVGVSTSSAREPPVIAPTLGPFEVWQLQTFPAPGTTMQCTSNGCTFGKHPNGASLGFPGKCCLDCKVHNSKKYSAQNHGPRCTSRGP
jgi:hypothetical protein